MSVCGRECVDVSKYVVFGGEFLNRGELEESSPHSRRVGSVHKKCAPVRLLQSKLVAFGAFNSH